MNIQLHNVLAFFHVVFFVYAIGGDIAVYFIGQYMTRDELSIEERLRVRSMRFLVDMSARTSLVLLLPIGFNLSASFGSPIKGNFLYLIWIASFLWLFLVWQVHFKKGSSLGELFKKIDLSIRYLLAAILIGFGSYCLLTNTLITTDWLALKIMLFGAILLNGIWIRSIVGSWQNAVDMVLSGDSSKTHGEELIKKNQATLNKAALLIWFLVITMAFLGQVKPF